MQKPTIKSLQSKKHHEKISAITAYDALFGAIFDGEVDIILIGDSLNMSFNGRADTTSLSLDSMIYHAKAVCQKVKNSFLIADMPFGSYTTRDKALKNATKLIRQTSIDAIKIEVNASKIHIIEALTNEGIAVMAHIGLMPQFIKFEGGYKIKGRDKSQHKALLDSALSCEQAGAFGMLLEGIIAPSAREITNALKIPTIGIGSGLDCDGQILVWSDMLGFFTDFKPSFVRRYLDGANIVKSALREYVKDVKNKNFPSTDESYT